MIQWLFRQTWLSLRGGIVSALISALTVAGALALVGVFAVVVFHARDVGERWHTLSGALVYLEPGIDSQQVLELQKRLLDHPLIEDARWVSANEALKSFASQGAEQAALVDGVSPELLESHFRLILKNEFDEQILEEWLAEVRQMGFVTTVDTAAGELKSITRWIDQFETIGLMVALLFIVVNGWVISNTIRIHISTRREELEILELIGASRSAVRLPFIIQGALIGLLSGLMASLMVQASTAWVMLQVDDVAMFVGNTSVPAFVHAAVWIIGLSAGAAGSLLATTVGLGDER